MHSHERLLYNNRFCNMFTKAVGCSNRHCKQFFRGSLRKSTATDDSFLGIGFLSQPPLKSHFQSQLKKHCYKDLNFNNDDTVAVIKTSPKSPIWPTLKSFSILVASDASNVCFHCSLSFKWPLKINGSHSKSDMWQRSNMRGREHRTLGHIWRVGIGASNALKICPNG